jgi:hypothetical protein
VARRRARRPRRADLRTRPLRHAAPARHARRNRHRERARGRPRALDLSDPTSHPQVGALTLREATRRLQEALAKLPELARAQEQGPPHRLRSAADMADRLELVLDEIDDTGFQQRPRLPLDGRITGPSSSAPRPRRCPPCSRRSRWTH